VVDGSHRDAIVSLVERRSMFLLLAKVEQLTTKRVCGAIIKGIKKLGIPAKTLTLDNGAEFCGHQRITEKTGMRCLLCSALRSLAAWPQRESQCLDPTIHTEGPALAQYTEQDIQRVADALNNRPRKRLGYRTPNELILRYLSRKKRALRT